MNEEEIKRVVQDTVATFGEQKVGIKLTRPETLQGWLGLVIAITAISTIIWKSFSFIHVVSKHHELPNHAGAEVLVERIEQSVAKHINEGDHIHQAELEMKIIRQTEPMKIDIQRIQQDVGAIKTTVDILLDREERRGEN